MVLDMHADVVHASGRNVTQVSAEAEELVSALLTDIDSAAAEVVHPVVAEAIAAYRADWMAPSGLVLIAEIHNAGVDTSASAVIVDEADVHAGEGLTLPFNG